MMLTIKPETRAGEVALLNNEGELVGTGCARASRRLPGYVSIICVEDHTDGTKTSFAVRVPANWWAELDQIRNQEGTTSDE